MNCKKCAHQPHFHSFKHIGKTSTGHAIYYSKPSLSVERQFTEESIPNYLAHMDDASGSPWVWVFDAAGLDKLEMPNPLLMRRFYLTMEERYHRVLKHIYILNMNWKVSFLLSVIRPFLRGDAKKRLVECDSPLRLLEDGFHGDAIRIAFQS